MIFGFVRPWLICVLTRVRTCTKTFATADSVMHDPTTFATQLGTKLATRSRHVCLLLGAGASRACGLPDISMLEEAVGKSLNEKDREVYTALSEERNLKQVLTRLRRITSLLTDGQELEGLSASAAETLDQKICEAVAKSLSLKDADLDPMRGLAAWTAGAQYHRPVEVFTVNYDLLVETALEEARALWFDGFVGSLNAAFRIDLVEGVENSGVEMPAAFTRLWKLHGSLNWSWSEAIGAIVRQGASADSGQAAAIYPADTKYEESRRVPYVVLTDRFRRSLNEPETLLLTSGYSFGDEHLDEQIFDAATRRPRSEFLAICHSTIPAELAERALRIPSLSVVSKSEAILGGERGAWEAEEPVRGIWEDGIFQLADFAGLTSFLARAGRTPEDANE